MKVEGVALGTLIAQYAGFLMALLLWLRYYKQLRKRVHWRGIWQKQAMYRFFQVNRDIFLRTLCLVAVTMFFTSAGAAQGEVVLAVNTLLMHPPNPWAVNPYTTLRESDMETPAEAVAKCFPIFRDQVTSKFPSNASCFTWE